MLHGLKDGSQKISTIWGLSAYGCDYIKSQKEQFSIQSFLKMHMHYQQCNAMYVFRSTTFCKYCTIL